MTSAATGEGLDELASAIFRAFPPSGEEGVRDARHPPGLPPGRGDAFSVAHRPGAFRVQGERVERLIARTT